MAATQFKPLDFSRIKLGNSDFFSAPSPSSTKNPHTFRCGDFEISDINAEDYQNTA